MRTAAASWRELGEGRAAWGGLTALAAVVGLVLMLGEIRNASATYDEPLYLSVAARWWRTGEQSRIARMGSPLTFWKLQQAPVLWALDATGHGDWIDHIEDHEAEILPRARAGALWIWACAWALTAFWARRLYGPRAMALAAWWFALSPNLLAHGPLLTMEPPIVATMTGMAYLFWEFLRTGDRRALLASAALGGLAFSCKFTAVVAPPIFGALWFLARWRDGERRWFRMAATAAAGTLGFAAIMALVDVIVTGGALLTLSPGTGEHPTVISAFGPWLGGRLGRILEARFPQDWAGFCRQAIMQRTGFTGYLLGELRETGWRYYFLVAMAVKVPPFFWLVVATRAALGRRVHSAGRAWALPAAAALFLVVASFGSTRNLGFRYLLPVAPPMIVWLSGLAETARWPRRIALAGLAAQALAVATIHPYELTYFNALAGGPIGGRRVLSDSNLDWGQGLVSLVRLQRERPKYRDLTLFYFGDTAPERYGAVGETYTVRAGVANEHLPKKLAPKTRYLAVSASIQWGPYGPRTLFRPLNGARPVRFTDDTTIAIYRTADLPLAGSRVPGRAVAPRRDRSSLPSDQ